MPNMNAQLLQSFFNSIDNLIKNTESGKYDSKILKFLEMNFEISYLSQGYRLKSSLKR